VPRRRPARRRTVTERPEVPATGANDAAVVAVGTRGGIPATPLAPAVAAQLRRRRQPVRVDLREWAGPIHFQGGFNTCAAHAGACLVAYFEKRARGTELSASRLFLYKVAKSFLQVDSPGSGVYVRQVMGVIKLVGTPPEHYWPYPDPGTPAKPRFDDPLLDAEPPAECYAAAADYRTVNYRLEDVDQEPDELLRLAKAHLAAHVAFAFDFPVYRSIAHAQMSGRIPFPATPQPVLTNHAVVAMGYDDTIEIGAGIDGAVATRGALLIKNSWSEQWGEKGYGWLPYEFVLHGRTRDFWTLLPDESLPASSEAATPAPVAPRLRARRRAAPRVEAGCRRRSPRPYRRSASDRRS